MFVRVVRFTDVTAERVASLVASIDETGPPPGVAIKKLQLVFDEAQGTAVVLQYFDDEESLRAGAETFAAMDPSETPGTRVSVDTGELKVERDALDPVVAWKERVPLLVGRAAVACNPTLRARGSSAIDERRRPWPGVQSRDFDSPDETRTPDKTQVDVVRMGRRQSHG